MSQHTTNYFSTFISVAEDCPVQSAIIPPEKESSPTIARMQFELLRDHPFEFTSDDLLFHIHAVRNQIPKKDLPAEKIKFFSKGQPCLRSSPLPKKYGWGFVYDEKGRISLVPMDGKEYGKNLKDKSLEQVKAMRSSRKA